MRHLLRLACQSAARGEVAATARAFAQPRSPPAHQLDGAAFVAWLSEASLLRSSAPQAGGLSFVAVAEPGSVEPSYGCMSRWYARAVIETPLREETPIKWRCTTGRPNRHPPAIPKRVDHRGWPTFQQQAYRNCRSFVQKTRPRSRGSEGGGFYSFLVLFFPGAPDGPASQRPDAKGCLPSASGVDSLSFP